MWTLDIFIKFSLTFWQLFWMIRSKQANQYFATSGTQSEIADSLIQWNVDWRNEIILWWVDNQFPPPQRGRLLIVMLSRGVTRWNGFIPSSGREKPHYPTPHQMQKNRFSPSSKKSSHAIPRSIWIAPTRSLFDCYVFEVCYEVELLLHYQSWIIVHG
jgi:hypothetical protein